MADRSNRRGRDLYSGCGSDDVNIAPCELRDANEFIARHHRHHKPVVGHRFSICVVANNAVRGVAVIGRPVARAIDQRNIVEVTRLCTDGFPNACSALYSAAARAAKAIGYTRIQTYILATENGASLKASGWKMDGTVKGRDWNCPSRGNRRTDQPMIDKTRWVKQLKDRL